MEASTFLALAMACAPQVHPDTARAIVQIESSFNPNAIGVVGGSLVRQPRSRAEAVVTIDALEAEGINYSVGLGQINASNFLRLGLNGRSALDPCSNLAALQAVLTACFERSPANSRPQVRLRHALSCYYSGDGMFGWRHGYVDRVVSVAGVRGARRSAASSTLKGSP